MSRFQVVSYKHYGRCYRLFNDQIEMLTTAELGPRIIRFRFVGGENEFAEVDLSLAIPGHGTWRLYGGHRLWHAPEDMIRTYIPDSEPVEFSEHADFSACAAADTTRDRHRKRARYFAGVRNWRGESRSPLAQPQSLARGTGRLGAFSDE